MSTLPALKGKLPGIYRKTSVLRRASWVLIVVPFSVLWVLVFFLTAISIILAFMAENSGRWLTTGKVDELEGSWADKIMTWFMNHSWYGVYRFLTNQELPGPKLPKRVYH